MTIIITTIAIIPNNNNKNRNNQTTIKLNPYITEGTHGTRCQCAYQGFGAILTGRQTRKKLQRLYEDQMQITFEKVRFKIYLVAR